MSDRVFLNGNAVIAEAAIRAGLDFFAGYPITPQTELLEYMSQNLPKKGKVFIQAESEVASVSMVQSASTAGVRSMTATSGPGLSLMAETLSNMALCRLPAVIVDVQRAAGNLTPEQSDYNYVTKGLGHNGLRGLVYAPANLQEAADITYAAFDQADKYSIPVIIMVDGIIGQMEEAVEMPDHYTGERHIDFIPPTGCEGRDPVGGRTQPQAADGQSAEDVLEQHRIETYNMYRDWVDTEVKIEEYQMEDADYVIIAYGSAARVCQDAVYMLRDRGYKVGMMRLVTLFPFPEKQVSSLKVKGVLTVEMALPPMLYDDVRIHLDQNIPHKYYIRCGGNMVDENEAAEAMMELIEEGEKK